MAWLTLSTEWGFFIANKLVEGLHESNSMNENQKDHFVLEDRFRNFSEGHNDEAFLSCFLWFKQN